jgi:sarcosine oxidase
MEEADEPFEIVDGSSKALQLPTRSIPAELLFDQSGGVIDVAAVGSYLLGIVGNFFVHEHVYAIENSGHCATLWTSTGKSQFDAVVLAAGAGTCPLAAQVGIYTPSQLAHHVRFSFKMSRPATYPSWIDTPDDGLGTYQHRSGPGIWAVGGDLDPSQTAWEIGRDEAFARSLKAVRGYAREKLEVVPQVVESLYCSVTPGLGDGFRTWRSGVVSAIHGENLFKFAPVLGEILAQSAVDPNSQQHDYVTFE